MSANLKEESISNACVVAGAAKHVDPNSYFF
jgi:hypothetical protein